ncbi:MAG: TetR/AcrR family transcriptional regulator [Saprospirales bacterium]|nr:TetR/AcrR family transcriptional regulator [Saprospirales bacterium]
MDNLSIPADSPGGPDSTEQRIFDAAHDVFVQKGLDGAKMQEIADRAGINKALLHYYYRSKEKLYETVARAVINRAFPVIRKMLESDDPLELKISRFIDFYIDLVSGNPFLPLLSSRKCTNTRTAFSKPYFPGNCRSLKYFSSK